MLKYKSIFSVTLLLILIFSVGAFAQQFDDVPRDHWAYDSVQTLAERGYLSLYSGEDFNGEEPLTRYEMAEIIANVLENTTAGGTASQSLSEEDVDVIRELSLEFRDELVTVAERQKNFEERLNSLEDTNQIQDEDIANINVRVSEMQEDVQKVSSLEESVNQIDSQIASLEDELAAIQEEGLSGEQLQELEDNQSVNMTRIEELENRIEELEAERTAAAEETAEDSASSLNTGYIIGGLALLALIL
ncbi:S-layer family protein [Halanaerobium saccharolyticum]|uniref:S-layer family protein n=1 Tax=Halanaerobium saccharolyticum TaxID=43595 RepID=A0A4R7ZAE5_9FIRM|nr:S-layer homology domain-containing protein [Halanaerobium saccharolyticum]RAK11191.1 S-layer family protein [Halanaerobium saccharolyticum]TDW07042.1 S-layer family protein [Halanaerobium saccharolyticum]TDX63807.1 S-layer family protein [Halanaerobium saccharolyticum]